ncbi:MAG: UDP-4-amino-4,6-dideoxy-L-N-acetyl-beta-L-altrosamine transaminase [Campylobacterota bacterium]|nr:UDP-4-amino-4,6-dideoxy-L-N-acetyl-beta-L-altrosamine transaminase [Campylobacterota bacterium]MDQ1338492.1 UDP-4-amino-4,6-dideoxy-L-N-acetyl-beta-L-altrosamine transaminase [Campylobacterota bacterium]
MLPYSTQLIEQDDIDAVVEVLKSPFLTQGAKVEEFEKALCLYTDSKHAVVFNSATSALLAAYTIVGIAKDDEIITTPLSFVATSNMFVSLGAKPIWCDIKLDGNIDENLIERLITPKTKAIVPVDFAGKVVEIEKINSIAKKHNLLVIQDSSHSLGSSINTQKVGSVSNMTILSFHAIKPITTGEGGAVLTDNEELVKKLRLFRSHGMVKKELWNSDMVSLGHNFRLTEIAAALGLSQLKKLDSFVKRRNEIAAYYDERFKNEKFFISQKIPENMISSRHLYPIILNPEFHCVKEDIFKELQARGLGVQVHYKPIYQNSFYREHFGDVSLSVADDFYKSEISLPCHQKMNMDDARFVADTFLEVLHKYSHRGRCF